MTQYDYLIVGQGLAGSLFAWQCLTNNKTFLIVDHQHKTSSSFIAAGLINPITGMRFTPSWQFETFFPIAQKYYIHLEKELNTKLWNSRRIHRIFTNEKEKAFYEQHKDVISDFCHPCDDGIIISPAAQVNLEHLLTSLKEIFMNRDALREEEFDYHDIKFHDNTVRWQDISFKHIVFCEGYKASSNPFFKHLPFKHAKGEILTLTSDDIKSDDIVIKHKWFVPQSNNTFKAGSTYHWDEFNETPTNQAKEEILKAMNHMWPNTNMECINHQAGVRPVIHDQKPVLGKHPNHTQLAILNGLGSKGTLWTPKLVQDLFHHLENDTILQPDVSIERFYT